MIYVALEVLYNYTIDEEFNYDNTKLGLIENKVIYQGVSPLVSLIVIDNNLIIKDLTIYIQIFIYKIFAEYYLWCLFSAWYRGPNCRPIRRCHSTCYDSLFSGDCTPELHNEERDYFCGSIFLHWSALGRSSKASRSCNIKCANIYLFFGVRMNINSVSDNMWIINRSMPYHVDSRSSLWLCLWVGLLD